MKINFSCFRKKNMQHLYVSSSLKLACLGRSVCQLMLCFFGFVLRTVNPFWIHVCYFLLLSFFGYWFLKVLKPRAESFTPRNLDLFFTSVSAATVSSMSTVEMEVFSNSQLVIITILMFIGGEVFTSMAGLFLRKFKLTTKLIIHRDGDHVASLPSSNSSTFSSSYSSSSSSSSSSSPKNAIHIIELGTMTKPESQKNDHNIKIEHDEFDSQLLFQSIKFLGFVVLGYLLVVNGLGIALVSLYLSLVSSAREVLKRKGLKLLTFSVFTTVSTFASCGFVPTNENMMVFSKNSGLLLILIPQVLLGNTLFPSCLRFSLWVLGKLVKKVESYSNYVLENTKHIGYLHLLPRRHSWFLVVTVFGFILGQVVMFCSMEWNSDTIIGMNPWEKIVGILFESVNTRHTGETILDLSIISPAILVLLVFFMYLPPYTSFIWNSKISNEHDEHKQRYTTENCEVLRKRKEKNVMVENLILSQLSYLAIFVILICITERQNIKDDPLNFSILNIVLEVISAYGNVGFTTGYSCKRRINGNGGGNICEDKWYGFVGRWSDEGKIILIAVMFFGRLKKFNMRGGKAWKLF